MDSTIRLLDVVALTVDRPEKRLIRGQVGTVVEVLSGGAYEVEFSDESDTEINTVEFPAPVGVPVMTPVVLLMLKPPGSPLAVQ